MMCSTVRSSSSAARYISLIAASTRCGVCVGGCVVRSSGGGSWPDPFQPEVLGFYLDHPTIRVVPHDTLDMSVNGEVMTDAVKGSGNVM